jgi:olfactory receptor
VTDDGCHIRLGRSLNSLNHTMILMHFLFCGTRIIHYFYCEFPAVVKLVCDDITVYETTVSVSTFTFSSPSSWYLDILASLSTVSFRCVLLGVREMPCQLLSPHCCFPLFQCHHLLFEAQAPAYSTASGSVFYGIITPTLNPLIYTCQNKDIAKALRRVL